MNLPVNLTVSEITEAEARAILAWRYEAPYSFYNADEAAIENDLRVLSDPQNFYFSVKDENGLLIAYYCFGRDAQVAGGDYAEAALDIGGGVRPDLTGRGFGATFIRLGTDFAKKRFAAKKMRATVAAFNHRALKMCENAGFRLTQTFLNEQTGKEFIVLAREI